MVAKSMGDGWFSGGDGGNGGDDRAEYERLIYKAGEQVLNNLQKLIVQLVKARDGDALQKLQSCTNQLYSQAAECLENDMDMEVSDDYQGPPLQ